MDNFERIRFYDRDFWALRDDLIGGEFNGNKARKLEYFLNLDLSGVKRIISYGSNQSNAMYSLSVFARLKNLEFIYVSDHISSYLLQNPVGNYAHALRNKMKFITNEKRREFALSLKTHEDLFIEEGVFMREAEVGFKTQANLIRDFAIKKGLKFDIFLPSGTGTSATYLSKNLPEFDVFTTPCVGDALYLNSQIKDLDADSKLKVLNPPKKYHFGDLKKELFEIYIQLKKQTNIEFELLYDSVGWLTLLSNLDKFGDEILYIHQGGVIGNESLIPRYERKFKLDYDIMSI
ncbi:1-aminocyclopropane-1-carboxylate deaminase [Campylobacter hyointestinalis subsp. hyointestinalis]|nr:1-aminocyclopropane-1-carboxylate deaminase [Campylobacter hyointestinalis subsp. hyointestinalis]